MGENSIVLSISPFIIVLMAILILWCLIKLNRISRRRRIEALYLMPLSFIAVYSWIGVLDPDFDLARTWVRLVILFNMGVALTILGNMLFFLKGRKK